MVMLLVLALGVVIKVPVPGVNPCGPYSTWTLSTEPSEVHRMEKPVEVLL